MSAINSLGSAISNLTTAAEGLSSGPQSGQGGVGGASAAEASPFAGAAGEAIQLLAQAIETLAGSGGAQGASQAGGGTAAGGTGGADNTGGAAGQPGVSTAPPYQQLGPQSGGNGSQGPGGPNGQAIQLLASAIQDLAGGSSPNNTGLGNQSGSNGQGLGNVGGDNPNSIGDQIGQLTNKYGAEGHSSTAQESQDMTKLQSDYQTQGSNSKAVGADIARLERDNNPNHKAGAGDPALNDTLEQLRQDYNQQSGNYVAKPGESLKDFLQHK